MNHVLSNCSLNKDGHHSHSFSCFLIHSYNFLNSVLSDCSLNKDGHHSHSFSYFLIHSYSFFLYWLWLSHVRNKKLIFFFPTGYVLWHIRTCVALCLCQTPVRWQNYRIRASQHRTSLIMFEAWSLVDQLTSRNVYSIVGSNMVLCVWCGLYGGGM